jgi:tetratricopeptide (TPR) repeat protein
MIRRLGSALIQTGDNIGAEAAFRQALTLREEAGPHIELSDALARQRRLAEALSQVQAAIALEPRNPHWHNRMAHVLLLADLPSAAEAEARAAVQLEPDHSGFQDTLVAALQRQGRADEALAESQRAAELAPEDVPRMVRLARALVGVGRPAEAEPVLLRAAALQPDLIDVHDLLSVVLERQERRPEAAAAAQRAAELLPDDLGRRHRLALVLMHMRDLAGAERVLREADLLASRITTFHHHHLLGIVFEWQGRLEESIAEARKASATEPGNWDLLGRVATLLLAAKKFDDADAVARKALALRPDNEPLQRLVASIQQQRPEPAAPSQEPALTEVIAAEPPTQRFASAEPAQPSREPATTKVTSTAPPAEHSHSAEPARQKIRATPRRQAGPWRAVLPSSLRQLLGGSPKSD